MRICDKCGKRASRSIGIYDFCKTCYNENKDYMELYKWIPGEVWVAFIKENVLNGKHENENENDQTS